MALVYRFRHVDPSQHSWQVNKTLVNVCVA